MNPYSNTQPVDDDKFRELILFIAERSEGDPTFGATKLNKLLFFSDFLYFVKTGKSITGHVYQALEHGPAPKALLPIQRRMEEAKDLVITKRDHFGKTQHRAIALRDPDLSKFTSEEIAHVTEILNALWKSNANEVSTKSHKFIGYKATKIGDDIPYATALISDNQEATESMRIKGAELESIARECLSR